MQREQTSNTLIPTIFSLTVDSTFIYKGAFNSWLWILTFFTEAGITGLQAIQNPKVLCAYELSRIIIG